jgi:hypothetical protein
MKMHFLKKLVKRMTKMFNLIGKRFLYLFLHIICHGILRTLLNYKEGLKAKIEGHFSIIVNSQIS